MLEQVHHFKLKTTEDMCAWHRSYRQQLEVERLANLNLRNTIADMQASAARGAEWLRKFQREWNGSPAYFEHLAEAKKYRQLARTWKRMALPELADGDSEYSDDDDLIDPEEKKRVAKEEIARIRAKRDGGAGEIEDGFADVKID